MRYDPILSQKKRIREYPGHSKVSHLLVANMVFLSMLGIVPSHTSSVVPNISGVDCFPLACLSCDNQLDGGASLIGTHQQLVQAGLPDPDQSTHFPGRCDCHSRQELYNSKLVQIIYAESIIWVILPHAQQHRADYL